jgi:hypothetical protein
MAMTPLHCFQIYDMKKLIQGFPFAKVTTNHSTDVLATGQREIDIIIKGTQKICSP